MTALKRWNPDTSQWEIIASSPQGATGPAGVIVSPTPPEDIYVLWSDTTEDGEEFVSLPAGGDEGDVLVKSGDLDYQVAWESRIRTYIQPTQPLDDGPYLWWDTSTASLTLWIEDGA